MIANEFLEDVKEDLMDAMTALYVGGKDDEFAQYLAANIVAIYEQIEIEMMERMMK